jgi:PAS domain S-box-containing protein
MSTPQRIGWEAGKSVAIALLYALAAQLGFRVAPLHPVVAAVWPPAGIALAVLLLGGIRLWPGVFIGAFAANAFHGIPVPVAALMGVGNTLSAVLAASLLNRSDFQLGLGRARDILLLLMVGALAAPLVSASAGTASLYLSGSVPVEHVFGVWLNWWSGDSIGVILVTPLIAVWARPRPGGLSARLIAEGAVVLSLLLAASLVLLGPYHEFKYAIFVLVGWIAVRYGLRGGTVSIALIAVVGLWQVTHGQGPFGGPGNLALWRFQIFIALLSVGSLVTATMATALRASELRFRRIFDGAGVGMAVVQPDGSISAANPALHAMLGYSGSELTGRKIADITHSEDWAAERTVIGKVLTGESPPYRVAKRYLRKDGSVFWGKLTATHIPNGDHGPGSAIKLIEDLSEQRSAEEALARDEKQHRRTTHLLQTLIDAAPLAIFAIDPEGRVRSWNRAAEAMFGWSEAEAVNSIVPFVPPGALPAFRESLDRVLGGESLTGYQVRRVRRDGIMLDLRICAAPTRSPDGAVDGIIGIAEDVTERKRMGEQLRQAQKMEAIGELTGGIAHDFNNLLTIVLTNAALLSDRIPPDQTDARVEVSELQRAAARGAELVRKLLTFSRKRDLELAPINLGEVLRETERSLRRLLPKSVEVITQVDGEGSLTIDGDVGAIEQIVFNLATNARDAMPEGGTLRLGLYRAWLDQEHRRTHGWGASGEYVVLAVSDTGSGMSPEGSGQGHRPRHGDGVRPDQAAQRVHQLL